MKHYSFVTDLMLNACAVVGIINLKKLNLHFEMINDVTEKVHFENVLNVGGLNVVLTTIIGVN